MITYYVPDTGRSSEDTATNKTSMISGFKEPRQKKTNIEQIIRGPVNTEEENRDLCNHMAEEKN